MLLFKIHLNIFIIQIDKKKIIKANQYYANNFELFKLSIKNNIKP